MAQALGYVTKIETGGYEGTLSTMSLKKRIRIVPNRTKETDMQPDFRVYTEDRVEIGGGWNRIGKTSGRPYVSLTFAAPVARIDDLSMLRRKMHIASPESIKSLLG